MSFSPVTIIGTPISHCVQTVIFTCEETGTPYTLQIEGHDTPAALRRPEHLQWHPFGCIPAIQAGEVKLYETSAICRYIDLVSDAPSLVPEDPLAAALMEQWVSSIKSYFHTPCISHLVAQYVFPRGADGLPDKDVISSAMPKINVAMEQLALAYEGNAYLAGNRFSLADLFVAPILMQMKQTPEGRECLDRFPVIEERIAPVFERPAFRKVLELHTRHLPATNCLLT